MRGEIKRLHQRLGATMIYVTHDQVEAMTLADQMAVLGSGARDSVCIHHTKFIISLHTNSLQALQVHRR
jgi:ABC-type sugar transport system ATPase subunit